MTTIFNYFSPKNDLSLLGDSTFDNEVWVPENYAITNLLQKEVEGNVINLAYDGATTQEVLEGVYIGRVLPPGEAKDAYMAHRAPNEQIAYPLQQLEENVKASPKTTHYVVLSVGGNDFRQNLLQPWRLLFDIPKIQQRYLQIVAKLKSLQDYNVRPILMFQYRTDANQDPYRIYTIFGCLGVLAALAHTTFLGMMTSPLWLLAGKVSALTAGSTFFLGAIGLYLSKKIVPLSVTKDIFLGKKIGMTLLGAMIERFYHPILEQAKKDEIPILDLPNTFHPYRKLYQCGIEPNHKGGELIVKGIKHIVTNHDFNGASMMYAKDLNNILASYEGKATNPSTWTVAYPGKK